MGKQFGGNDTFPEMFIDVTTTVNYEASHLRHLIRLSGPNANYVFPLATPIPVGYQFRVNNFGTDDETGKVTFSNAPLLWGSSPKNELDIQFTGTYEFEFDGTNWNCTMFNALPGDSSPKVMYSARVSLGTMTSTDQVFIVTIPFVAGANYAVIGNLVSLGGGGYDADNDVMFVIANKTSTNFGVAIRRISGGPQNLGFDFIII